MLWVLMRLKIILQTLVIRAFNQFKLITMQINLSTHPAPIEFFNNQTVKKLINRLKNLSHKIHKIKILNLTKQRSFWKIYLTCVKTWKMRSEIKYKTTLNKELKLIRIYARIPWTWSKVPSILKKFRHQFKDELS